ncbi:hypothetical protein ASF53_05110 [Methylobacterium sp. Leaf123]|uniref:BrnA antitoxin family protein n=1 Tax=Methylobacterium sp. Leaf123 TaxID=1736264 RepID=UPI0006F7DBA8|nr:BrnA antitoxin family protein [Methylobacterium sp. Leaf123]KQQ23706.1 hypothetical protein ASF53_05110 [Methylobacterium sp. Leaf123]
MTANRPATPRFSADAVGKTDFAKVDAHVITAEEYEELPELTDEMMDRADFLVGGKLVRRGRPAKPDAKEPVSLRLSPTVLAHFRAGGPGWQTRINAVLLEAVEREKAGTLG